MKDDGRSGQKPKRAAAKPSKLPMAKNKARATKGSVNREGQDARTTLIVVATMFAIVAGYGISRTLGPEALDLAEGSYGRDALANHPAVQNIGPDDPTAEYQFVLADDVDIPAVTRAPGWVLEPPSDLETAARQLAVTLGAAVPQPASWDPQGFTAKSSDGSVLWITRNGDWNYTGPDALLPTWNCPDANTQEKVDLGLIDPRSDCTRIAPTGQIPTSEQAKQLGLDLYARLGFTNVTNIFAFSDELGAVTSGDITLPGNGNTPSLSLGAGFGPDGQLAWAFGTLAVAKQIGTYPLLSINDAMPLLQQDLNRLIAVRQNRPADTPPDDTQLVQVDTATISRIEIIEMLAQRADGNWYILPHYRLTDTGGGIWDTLAVLRDHVRE